MSSCPLPDSGCWCCPQQFHYLSGKTEWCSPLYLEEKSAKLSMRTWKTHGSSYNAVKQGTVRRPGFQCLLCPHLRCDPQNLPSQAHLNPPLQSDGSYQCMHPLSQHPLWATLFLPVPWHLSFSTQDASPLRSIPWGPPGVSGASSACLYPTIHHRITKRFLWVYSDLSTSELRAGQPVFSMFVHCVPRGRLTIKLMKLKLRALGSWGLFQGPGRARSIMFTQLVLSSL